MMEYGRGSAWRAAKAAQELKPKANFLLFVRPLNFPIQYIETNAHQKSTIVNVNQTVEVR